MNTIARLLVDSQATVVTPDDDQWKVCLELFQGEFGGLETDAAAWIDSVVDRSRCRAVVDNGAVVGGYAATTRTPAEAIADEGMQALPVLDAYEGKRGVECVAIVVAKSHRRHGLSKALSESARAGFDYEWLMQYYELKTAVDWERRGYVVVANNDRMAMYATPL